MRARTVVVSSFAAVLLLAAGPASALGTKPTNPPPPPDSTVVSPPPVPYIEAVRYAGGNGDQTPDPGERLQVFFSLRNPTEHALTGVTGTMIVKGDGITVIDDTATWPDIARGALEASSTPFIIRIADSAARATPCNGGLRSEPAPGTVTPVASDGVISSDGNASSGAGSAPASSGSAEPAGTASAEPSIVEPAPPSSVEPAPGGTLEPAPEPSGTAEPAPDAPVPFDAALTVHTTAGSFDAGFGSGVACPLATGANGGAGTPTTTGTKPGAPETTAVAADAARAPSGPSSLPLVLAVVMAAAGALVARYHFTA